MKRYITVPIEVNDDNPKRCTSDCEFISRQGLTDEDGVCHPWKWVCENPFEGDKDRDSIVLREDKQRRPIRCRACLRAESRTPAGEGG